ncbi:MAG: hypothetical protein U0792_06850 [Gemmataceae bacterium]
MTLIRTESPDRYTTVLRLLMRAGQTKCRVRECFAILVLRKERGAIFRDIVFPQR